MENKPKKKSNKKFIFLIFLLIAGSVGYVLGKPYYELHFKTVDLSEESKMIYIPTNSNLDDVGLILENQGVLSSADFIAFAEKLDFTSDKVEPGKYEIKAGMKIKNVIYALKNGNQEIKDVRITFNNCKSVYDIAGKVAPAIEADSASLAQYLSNPQTIDKYGFKDETFMSMFLPDTYEVGEWDMTAEEFTQFMAEEYKKFWGNEGEGNRKDKLKKLNLSQSEVATVASIVEAEQGKFSQEWKTIAGLYLNRIRQGIKLQSDPTFKFCWGNALDTVQRLTYAHRDKDCPYNTYIYAGLPPGPIRIPSKQAIDAVLNAEDHDYIFMCARPDNSGLHNFAVTLSQHNENAAKFRKYMDSLNL